MSDLTYTVLKTLEQDHREAVGALRNPSKSRFDCEFFNASILGMAESIGHTDLSRRRLEEYKQRVAHITVAMQEPNWREETAQAHMNCIRTLQEEMLKY